MCNNKPYLTFNKDKLVLRIYHDDLCESPRLQDNKGTMVCFHKRLNYGDEHDFNNPDEFLQYVNDNKIPLVLPIFMYEHSSILFSLRDDFIDKWDSGQVGYIYMNKKEYDSYKDKNEAIKCLEAEIHIYNNYVNGEVYGYELIKQNKCPMCHKDEEEIQDSCYGFYGDDFKLNGLFESANW
jgi:hypothetical protein